MCIIELVQLLDRINYHSNVVKTEFIIIVRFFISSILWQKSFYTEKRWCKPKLGRYPRLGYLYKRGHTLLCRYSKLSRHKSLYFVTLTEFINKSPFTNLFNAIRVCFLNIKNINIKFFFFWSSRNNDLTLLDNSVWQFVFLVPGLSYMIYDGKPLLTLLYPYRYVVRTCVHVCVHVCVQT